MMGEVEEEWGSKVGMGAVVEALSVGAVEVLPLSSAAGFEH